MFNYSDLKNKVVVITGAGGLLGKEFSLALGLQGAVVIGIDNKFLELKNNFSEIKKRFPKIKLFAYKCNISKNKEIQSCFKNIKNKFKKIDILINNAHTKTKNLNNFFTDFENYKLSTWKEVMEVNVNSVFLVSQAVAKIMIKQKHGNIIQISSIQGILGNDGRIYKGSKLFGRKISSPAVYSTSKSAVIGFTRYLSTYLAKYNIRVNCISPGGIENNHNKKFIKKYSNKVPLNRMGKKNEIASAILFLSSAESSYVTGQNIVVDGGYSVW